MASQLPGTGWRLQWQRKDAVIRDTQSCKELAELQPDKVESSRQQERRAMQLRPILSKNQLRCSTCGFSRGQSVEIPLNNSPAFPMMPQRLLEVDLMSLAGETCL